MSTTAEHEKDAPESRRESLPTSERSVTLGQYRVIAKLGTGGMAEVYLAVAQGAMNVNRLVVVKRLREEQASDPASRAMFLDEARLAARLNHPNVIQTFEAGAERGSYFLAMEYVEGQPLSRVLTKLKQDGRRLPAKMAARIIADALAGLHYAHTLADFDGSPLAIVHRDVSPQNIMLTYGGVTKIVDFGIAKAAGSTQTAHGVFKGKVAFMAPEQVLGENVDGRADVFAAGIVLWEALTGKHLMAADSPAKTLHNLMNKKIPRVSEIVSDVPAALDQIVAKSLERDLVTRYGSAKAMRDALESFIAAEGGMPDEEIGEVVSTLFADRKKSVQEQVKAQLAALSLARTSDPDIHTVSKTHVRSVIDLSEGATGDSEPSIFRVVTTGSGLLQAPAPARPANRWAVTALVFVTSLALGVSGLALYRAQHALPIAPAPAVTVTVSAPATAAPSVAANQTASAASTAAVVSATAAAPSSAAKTAAAPPTFKPATYAPPPHTPPKNPAPVTPATAQAAPTADAPRPPPTVSAQPAPQPADTAQGRTFRRDL